MKVLSMAIPPLPVFIKAGKGVFRKGRKHFRRTYTVFDCIYVQSGTLYMREEDIEYEVKAGEYILLIPGFEHAGYRNCTEDTSIYWFHFVLEGLFACQETEHVSWSDLLNREETFTEPAKFTLQIPRYGGVQNKEMAERLLEDLVNGGDSVESKLQQPVRLYQFLLFLQKEALGIPSAAEKVSEQAAAYLRMHYREDVKMTDVARHILYNVDYITRCMQKQMGISPLQYLNEIRLSEAKKRLVVTNDKIKVIARDVGFMDEGYFSRLFRKKEGVSPLTYRRMVRREGV
ncbi:AraC family transcriptional regulator [Ectobacillus sp. JY-23]|uniref:AraC family transcriptional regulator n=1 Tax=Ectobacillus sp. JY-23 TaxID=2933872 RepID=UPI001FF1F3C4|nr:AraC family transcriptional regulator [Ectobacillus sp. JY-23]UOY92105.1 AraC family transcriptional regulator [Ectobacillus sp. JY-23]